MDSSIALILLQDGIVNGAIYALLGMALVLVFAVTRVIFIPQGEFVAFGALTLAMLVDGKVPGTAYLLPLLGVVCLALELLRALRTRSAAGLPKAVLTCVVLPLALLWLTITYTAAGNSLWPVSYTHLDVYKRQGRAVLGARRGAGGGGLDPPLLRRAAQPRRDRPAQGAGRASGGDVYKRQTSSWAPAWARVATPSSARA